MPTCPICLQDLGLLGMSAPIVTKCGHHFCVQCMLHYLVDDIRTPIEAMTHHSQLKFTSRPCPLCYVLVRKADLRNVRFLHHAETGLVSFRLMQRSIHSTVAIPREHWHTWAQTQVPRISTSSSVFFAFCKVMIGTEEYLRDEAILPHLNALQAALIEAEESNERLLLQCAIDEGFAKLSAFPPPTSSSLSDPARSSNLGFGDEFGLRTIEATPSSEKSVPSSTSPCDFIYFYQACDGQSLYLHPLDIKILKETFGSYDSFPLRLEFYKDYLNETLITEVDTPTTPPFLNL